MKRIHSNTAESTSVANSTYRDRIDLLRSRISLLAGKDKLLLTMHLENGNSFRQIAQLVGVNEASIGRRIRKIMRRLIDGEYITCLRNREKFTEAELAIAKDYFLQGESIRKIAIKRELTYYSIRKTIKKIQPIVTTAEKNNLQRKQKAT